MFRADAIPFQSWCDFFAKISNCFDFASPAERRARGLNGALADGGRQAAWHHRHGANCSP